MKKLYLLLAGAMLAAGSQAATLKAYINGNEPIENGSTVYSNNKEIWPAGDFLDVTMDPELYFEGDQDGTLTVVVKSLTPGQQIQICCGGQCEFGMEVTKYPEITAGEKLPAQLEWLNGQWPEDEDLPVVTIAVEACYSNTPADKLSFTIVLGDDSGAVKGIAAEENTLSVSNGTIMVNGAAADAVYSIDGRRVANGSLSKGMYIAGGKKVIVK